MTEELSLEARALIERAVREEPPASSVVLAKIRRQVISVGAAAGTIGVAGKVAAAGAGSVLAGGTSTAVASSVFGSLLLGAALGVGVTVGPQLFDSTDAPLPSASSERAGISPVAPGTRAEAAPPAPVPAETRNAGAPLSAKVPSAHTPQRKAATSITAADERAPTPTPLPEKTSPERQARSGADLRQELALLERVQGELRAGNGARALELLDERPATRQLTTEYLAAEVFAACQTGQRERARRAAERFLRLHPAGPLASRVRNSCAGLESGGSR